MVAYWRDKLLVFENYRAGVRVTADPITLQILDFFDDWRDPATLATLLEGYSVSSLLRAVSTLVDCSLLERSDRKPTDRDRAFEARNSWHPGAGLLHFSSKDVTYEGATDSYRSLQDQARRQPMPAPVKRCPDAECIALPPPRTAGEFPRVLLDRRTWRRFSRSPLPLTALATLLGLSCAVQYWVELPGIGRLPLKTFPSGGAQHPLELYVLARRVAGLAPGLYHYASDEHQLERLRKGTTNQQIVRYLPSQWWFRSAAALLFITAVFPRAQWKYPFSRAYRAVLTEAGHLCQSLCLTATWLKLAPFCSLALADSLIERDLEIDGVSESVLYAAGVGMRPSGTTWAPWPGRPAITRTKAFLASPASRTASRRRNHASTRQTGR